MHRAVCLAARKAGSGIPEALLQASVYQSAVGLLIILRLVVGVIARAVAPGRQPMRWIATAVLGIVGAYVGGTLASVVFPPHQSDIHPPFRHSFLGAQLLLWIFKLVTSRTRGL
jgi:uncharacterized membrane protein YeaQ/YmgE (transglycosylase-associated protein family)